MDFITGDEAQYCNKNVATTEATNFNYKLRVRTNLRGVGTICAAYNVSLFHWSSVMEWISWNQILNLLQKWKFYFQNKLVLGKNNNL